ncbi:CHP3 protein, partial [Polypterus senegalus]
MAVFSCRREDFDKVTDLDVNPIRAQIIEAFFDKRNFGGTQTGPVEEINFEQFLTVMSHFRPVKTRMTEEQIASLRKEKLQFLFNMYDIDADGKISLEDYRHEPHQVYEGMTFEDFVKMSYEEAQDRLVRLLDFVQEQLCRRQAKSSHLSKEMQLKLKRTTGESSAANPPPEMKPKQARLWLPLTLNRIHDSISNMMPSSEDGTQIAKQVFISRTVMMEKLGPENEENEPR